MVETSKAWSNDPETSDSDLAPDETTISVGKMKANMQEMVIQAERERQKEQVKEARKRKQERNVLQQAEKKKRLMEESKKRLSKDILDAVVAEQKTQPKQKVKIIKTKRNSKTFNDDDDNSNDSPLDETIDEEGKITLQRGVKVRTLKEEIKKNVSIAEKAADFKKRALYGDKIKRITGRELQQMDVKQKKSGKAYIPPPKIVTQYI
nr:uncharacterized protein LOC128689761 isoform X1 [Cherax quadricarinatus]